MPEGPHGDEETRTTAGARPVGAGSHPGDAPPPVPPAHTPTATLTPSSPVSPVLPGPSAPIGRPWAHLTVLDEIGSGGFGRVYRAWDPLLAREVALKLMKVPDGEPEAAATLLREGRMLARVRHANVVTVHGAQQVASEIGLWMELVRGRSLSHVVASDGPMSAGEAAITGASLCRALAAVHAEHLVHRDVKAQNVMREAGGRIVLMDFGTGRELARDGATDTVGTPVYMAPEVLKGGPASVCSDIYSVGVLLYFLVTGRYPFEGRSMVDMIVGHSVGRRDLLTDRRPDLPDDFVRVVERALGASPADRYQTAGAMLRDLAQATVAGNSDAAVVPQVRALTATPEVVQAPPQASLLPRAGVLAAAGVVGAAVLITALGWLTTATFNNTLGRPGSFAPESWWDTFVWGARSLVAPLTFSLIAAAPFVLTQVAWRLATTVSGRVNKWWVAVRLRLASWRSRWLPPHAVPSVLALAQALALALAWWAFSPLVAAVTSFVDMAPPGVLARLGVNGVDTQLAFRFVLAVLGFASTVAWAAVLGDRPFERPRGSWIAPLFGVVLIFATLAFLTAPYRLFSHARFERVTFEGARCYELGRRERQVLLSCPELPPPRNRLVAADDRKLEPSGVLEELFDGFERAPGR